MRWLKRFRRFRREPELIQRSPPTDMDAMLGYWSASDDFRLRDAVCGTLVLGDSGSGKSSGAARWLRRCFLASGMGGLLLTVKESDLAELRQDAEELDRSNQLVVIEPGGPHCCNILDLEADSGGDRPALRLENIVGLFDKAMEISERGRPSQGGSGENVFFQRAVKGLLRAAILPLLIAKQRITLDSINRVILSAPRSLEEAKDPAWRNSSFCYQTLCNADDHDMDAGLTQDFEYSLLYLMDEWPSMDARTRSNILSTFTTTVDPFRRGFCRDLFFGETTITPDACRNGTIIVINLPTLTWNETGRVPQALFKFAWQRCQERCAQELKQNAVFLFSDEASQFFTSFDSPFQATARGSRVCCAYIAQNLPIIYDSIGGESARHTVDGWIGNLRLKIFHNQTEPSTCQFQSELGGKVRRHLFNSNSQGATADQFDFFHPRRNHSAGMSESWEYEIQPWEWSRDFRRGGAQHNYQVDAIAFQGGTSWNASGSPYLPITFNQR